MHWPVPSGRPSGLCAEAGDDGAYESLGCAEAEGHYRELTVPLAGQSGRGASRIVTGANGDAYYRSDHSSTFMRIRWLVAALG